MKDFIPSWLEDPGAFSQPANLDLDTVFVVAAANFWAGVLCLIVYELARRKYPKIYSPKADLCPGTCPDLLHKPCAKPGAPLSWVRPLMRLDEEDILRCLLV